MFKVNRLLAIIVLFFFAVSMGSCGGGGGGGGNTGATPPSTETDGPAFDATGGNINEDALLVVIGSSSFSAPTSSVLLKQRSAEPYFNEVVQAQALVDGVPWVPQVPPGSWKKTGNCGPTSYLMAESFHFKYPLNPDNSEDSIKKIVDWLVANRDDFHPPQGEDYYNGDINGTSIYQLADLAIRKGGFESRPITSESPDILLEELEKGHPVIVRVLYQGCLENIGCNNTDDMKVERREEYGHYMLLVGMDDTYVYVNDPGRSLTYRNYAEYKRYTLDSFKRVWNQLGPQGQNVGVILYPKGSRLPIGIDAKSLSLGDGKINQPYYATLAAIDGQPPYKWTIVNGNLPDGLYLTQDGKITGTPIREGKFIFTLRVEDSTQDVADATTSITISSVAQPLKINTARELPTGRVNAIYSMGLSASGGTGPYMWTKLSGNMPNGLSLIEDGRIVGTPSVSGTHIFSLQVSDNSSPQQIVSKEFSITTLPSNTSPIIYSITSGPSTINPNSTSTVTCTASDPDNDPLTYSWSKTNGTFQGSVSGPTVTWIAPATAGTYTVTCTVSDGKGGTASQGINITVQDSTTPLSIATPSLPTGTVDVSYSAILSATGGKTPYTWSITSGSLPSGLSLSSGGSISGIPTTAGTYNFAVQVKDSSSPQQTATKDFSVVINPPSTYSVSGKVFLNGSGLSGVTITLTGTGSTTTTTGSDGNYTFTGAQNGSYTIAPLKSGYTFSPSSRSITVNNANVTGQDFTATPTAAGVLQVTPNEGLTSSGKQGGPFTPSSKTYTLSNTGGNSINWTATKGQSWLDLSAPTSGTLTPGGTATVTVSVNSSANSLAPNTYSDTINFTNTTNGNGNQSRSVSLTVTSSGSAPMATTGAATNITSNSATLNGTVNPNGLSTTVHFEYTASPASGWISTGTANAGSGTTASSWQANISALAPNTLYYFRIVAQNSAGTTVGDTLTFTTSSTTTTLLPPTLISPGSSSVPGTNVPTTTPTFQWQGVSGAARYGLYISQYPYGAANLVYQNENVSGSSTSFTVPSGYLQNGVQYRWNMTTFNSVGQYGDFAPPLYFIVSTPSTLVERITNGSFSSGASSWTLAYDFWAGTDGSYPRTSPGHAAGGVNSSGYPKDGATGWMYQTVIIPANATTAALSFWYYITTQETGSTGNDFLNVTIQDSSGNYLATVAYLSNLHKGTGYNQITFNMLPYKGQTIRINFLATTNPSLNTVFRIDDVSLMADGN